MQENKIMIKVIYKQELQDIIDNISNPLVNYQYRMSGIELAVNRKTIRFKVIDALYDTTEYIVLEYKELDECLKDWISVKQAAIDAILLIKGVQHD